ncbi:TPA: hypothetical protein N3F15_000914 [Klebsiella aerogenes]|nr:hypothetical protein [Klebsiella aerogenes]
MFKRFWVFVKNKYKDNKIRFFYSFAFIITVIVTWCVRDYFLSDTDKFNLLSYVGTVFTILGLMITFLEILHGLLVTKSLQKQARELLDNFKDKEYGYLSTELITMLEYINTDINDEQYSVALRQLYSFTRTFERSRTNYMGKKSDDFDYDGNIKKIEISINNLKNIGPGVRIPNRTRNDLIRSIVEVKHAIMNRKLNVGGGQNVAS